MTLLLKLKIQLMVVSVTLLFIFSSNSFAALIKVAPHTIITQATTFTNDTLDMTDGSFIIKNQATLTLDNCSINGTLSPTNPFLFRIEGGVLLLANNTMNIEGKNIIPNPNKQSIYQMIRVIEGLLSFINNTITARPFFTVGFLVTNRKIHTADFNITNNVINGFHGGLYLLANSNANITDNFFTRVSWGNIFIQGNNNLIKNNVFLDPGNFADGDTIDVINSAATKVIGNTIEGASCTAIAIGSSQNIVIDSNKIIDGLTYAISIDIEQTVKNGTFKKSFLADRMRTYQIKFDSSSNISIKNNHFAFNRYGINASNVDNLIIQANVFTNKFANNYLRKFWTDNTRLLLGVTNLTWSNNLYKEAYPQDLADSDNLSLQVVEFPVTGGVSL